LQLLGTREKKETSGYGQGGGGEKQSIYWKGAVGHDAERIARKGGPTLDLKGAKKKKTGGREKIQVGDVGRGV